MKNIFKGPYLMTNLADLYWVNGLKIFPQKLMVNHSFENNRLLYFSEDKIRGPTKFSTTYI